jgi:hypothetical protein
MSTGRDIPLTSVLTEESVEFVIGVLADSGVPERIEALLRRHTGRPRTLSVNALFVALVLLAIDDRPLHLKAAARLLWRRLSPQQRQALGVTGGTATRKAFLARYRQVRYLFHQVLGVMDPSVEVKNRVMDDKAAILLRKKLTPEEIAERQRRLEEVLAALIEASVRVCSDDELSGFDGSVGLDATPVPLFSRGPSARTSRSASDPDGGWYIREGDHREETGPKGKKLRKIFWALDATIVTMGRPPGQVAMYPNLFLGASLARPGEDPGGAGTRLLSSVRERGWPAGFAGADRGYSQCLPEHFHLPLRSLGYSVVMDYKATELGYQANSQGAVLVDGAWYCPAMPELLVRANSDHREATIDEATFRARIEARASWRLQRKQGPDADGYERWACPAIGGHPKLCCPLRGQDRALGQVPVLSPPKDPPKICCQTAITIAPDVGARHRQDLAFGSEEWARAYATYRNTIEGQNGFVKDPAHEALAQPGRRRVRGIAAQSLFVGFLLMAANFRKIAAFREMTANGDSEKVAERARRRRTSITDYRPPPPPGS